MTMDMAKETIKLHTKRITAILLPVFRISCGKTECFSGLNQSAAKSPNHTPVRRDCSLGLGDGQEVEDSGSNFAGCRSAAKKQSLSFGRSTFPLAFLGSAAYCIQ